MPFRITGSPSYNIGVVPYTPSYYSNQENGSSESALIVLPIIQQLINPRSVVDVGCGVGTWLAAWQKLGVDDVFGYDGIWVKPERLHIPRENFETIDLTATAHVDKKADLAMCMEVGEHIDGAYAAQLVKTLTSIAPVVLFSAAIPFQGGTHHINEQWPSYWARHFRACGFVPIDCIRSALWNDPKIEYWYAQNAVLYVQESAIDQYPDLTRLAERPYPDPLPLVHPTKFLYVATRYRLIEPILAFLPGSAVRQAKRALMRVFRS